MTTYATDTTWTHDSTEVQPPPTTDTWTRIRRGLTPTALMLGPVLLAVGFALHDEGLDDDVAFVRAIDGHVNRWMLTHLLIVGRVLCHLHRQPERSHGSRRAEARARR